MRAEGLEPSRALRPNGFSYPSTAFAAPAVLQQGVGSGLSLHRVPGIAVLFADEPALFPQPEPHKPSVADDNRLEAQQLVEFDGPPSRFADSAPPPLNAILMRSHRGQLPIVCASPAILKRFAEGKLSMQKAHERAVDSGADSVPYKRAAAFRRWITEQEIDSLLAGSPQKVRDKLMYEFEKIATRIAFLKKKHS